MRRLLVIAGFVVLVIAKPETYKEKEDFQYSRSSTDEGSKSGYYGAQRGNMGGNYEKAHNMDTLAQSQMSGIMHQVHGELGSGINTPTGNVYGAASTRGKFGQGNYDLSNLSGRNFEESDSYGGASHLSHSLNAGYGGQSSSLSQSSGKSSSYSAQNRYEGSERQTANEFEADSIASSNQYRKGYERSSGYNSGYQSQSRYSNRNEDQRRHRDYEKVDNVGDGHYRITPLKVILRPGSRVDVPFTAETYKSGNVEEFDENQINQESRGSNQNNRGKSYQSSFSYNKEWEKHDSQPSVAPLSIPSGSSTYDAQAQDEYQNQHSSNSQYSSSSRNHGVKSAYASVPPQYHQASSGYDRNYGKSSSMSQARDEYGYNQHASSSSNADTQQGSSAYRDFAGNQNHIRTSDTSPKKYESSYSYHKSWERKGDPYVILPGSDGTQTSQKLTDASSNNKYSREYGSQQYRHSHQEYTKSHGVDC